MVGTNCKWSGGHPKHSLAQEKRESYIQSKVKVTDLVVLWLVYRGRRKQVAIVSQLVYM